MELPVAFIEQIKELLPNEYEAFFKAMDKPSPVSVRLNDKVSLTPNYPQVPHCKSGYYLPERPTFTLDPWFHAGVYYVQEAGSMFLEQVVRKYLSNDESTNRLIGDVLMTEGNNRLTPNSSLLTPNYIGSSTNSKAELHAIRALDLCAAPGGKSTHLASLLSDDSLLISNEVMPQRAHILAENATKWGYGSMMVTNNRPADFGKLEGYFDLLLTDVPCSGEGMFRKDEKAIEDWSPAYVLECAERQRSILTDVWPALKQNGLLIYSTCTFNKAENEDNIAWIAQELGAEILESRHFYFHTDQSEGLFMAALRKTAPTTQMRVKSKVESRKSKVEGLKSPLINSENWCIKEEKDLVYALPKAYEADFAILDKHLRWLKKGIGIATLKGKNQTPHIDLALSRHINKEAFITYELDLPTALHYLKGESITLPDAPIGYLLLTFKGVPMGWGKNIGNRCNNLYPDAWRIRMNIPDTLCTLPF
jgi:16S rRNA C967 or C1407 C5-methylase (RsmB/RsmF family)/NOL1/NOP2/fmu family ribosome biogenesis protein